MTFRTTLALALLAAAAPALGQQELPHTFTPGTAARAGDVNDNFAWLAARDARVIWKKSPTCDEPCRWTASSLVYPNPSGYTVVAALDLPAGSWLLSAKLSTHAMSDVAFGDLECVLGPPDGEQDFTSVGLAPTLGGEKALSLQVPLVAAGPRTAVRLGCKLYGTSTDGTTPIAAKLWGAKIFAVQVASIVQQP